MLSNQNANKSASRSPVLVGLATMTALVACDAPETGSLENAKNQKLKPAAPAPVDYAKLDYAKLDYAKIDYAKLDYGKLDYSKIDAAKLSEEQRIKVATETITALPSTVVSQEITRRLENQRKLAEVAKDKKALTQIDSVLAAIKIAKSWDTELCW